MEQELKISYYKPDKQGVFPIENGYCFATEMNKEAEGGIIFYKNDQKKFKIPFSIEGKRGSLYGIQIEGSRLSSYCYQYYIGNRLYTDNYAPKIAGLEIWGDWKEKPRTVYGKIMQEDFDWESDAPLLIPYEETIIYGLNVRGFTMHKSSGVKQKGTFEGIIEKIPYLKQLGITAIELMPAYEFDECMYKPDNKNQTMEEAVKNSTSIQKEEKRLNCWGFQKGFYFAPKASYSATGCPERSFKNMVKELHRNGIEVMMQFYFPPDVKQAYILEVLKFWVIEYHIDGIRLSGFQIPFQMIAEEPVLKETKIRGTAFPFEEIYGKEVPAFRNLSVDNGDFRNDMKRYLKGDEGLMNQVLYYQRNNPPDHGVINSFTDYDGFTLYDCVSYERKHNEANGEENRDGSDLNYSWNCGVEGDSRKKAILELRMKQMKNAMAFLFLAQGTPFIFSGDEMANTRYGNNNVYCQDNETGWVKWKNTQFSNEILNFTRFMIKTRKAYPVLHMKKECQILDYKSCGYPDLSYHGIEPWRPDTSYISRMAGIMLCGKYVPEKDDDSFYIAYNMHWEPHKLALPNLPKGLKWMNVMDTSFPQKGCDIILNENSIQIGGRSVALYQSVKDDSYVQEKNVTKSQKKAEKKK